MTRIPIACASPFFMIPPFDKKRGATLEKLEGGNWSENLQRK
jgi:hypothetical protein